MSESEDTEKREPVEHFAEAHMIIDLDSQEDDDESALDGDPE